MQVLYWGKLRLTNLLPHTASQSGSTKISMRLSDFSPRGLKTNSLLFEGGQKPSEHLQVILRKIRTLWPRHTLFPACLLRDWLARREKAAFWDLGSVFWFREDASLCLLAVIPFSSSQLVISQTFYPALPQTTSLLYASWSFQSWNDLLGSWFDKYPNFGLSEAKKKKKRERAVFDWEHNLCISPEFHEESGLSLELGLMGSPKDMGISFCDNWGDFSPNLSESHIARKPLVEGVFQGPILSSSFISTVFSQ